MKSRLFALSLVVLSSILTIGCKNENMFSYERNEFSEDYLSSFSDYFSSKTGETLRLYENGKFEFYLKENTLVTYAQFCGKYLICNFDNNAYQTSNKIDYYSFVFILNDKEIIYLKDYSTPNNYLHSQTYERTYESEYEPLYHYKQDNRTTLSVLYYLDLSITSKDDSLKALNNQKLISYNSEFRTFESLGFSLLSLTIDVSEDSILDCIKTINNVDSKALIACPSYGLNKEKEDETIVNLDYYGLTKNDEVPNATHYDMFSIPFTNEKLAKSFAAYDEMLEYKNSISDERIKDYFVNYFNTFDKTIFDEHNVVFTDPLISASSQNIYIYSGTYLKDDVLFVIFNPTLNYGGYQVVTTSIHVILLSKQLVPNAIKTIS